MNINLKAIRAAAEKIQTVDGFDEPEKFDYLFHQYGIETRPEVMFELLDRLEAAEKDAADWKRRYEIERSTVEQTIVGGRYPDGSAAW